MQTSFLDGPYNQFNNTSPEKTMTLKMLWTPNSIDQIPTLKFPDKCKSLTLFHINACPLNTNFDAFDYLLKYTNKVFDIISVSETRITKQTSLTTNKTWKIMPLSLPLLNLQLGSHSSTLLVTYLINYILILIFIKLIS